MLRRISSIFGGNKHSSSEGGSPAAPNKNGASTERTVIIADYGLVRDNLTRSLRAHLLDETLSDKARHAYAVHARRSIASSIQSVANQIKSHNDQAERLLRGELKHARDDYKPEAVTFALEKTQKRAAKLSAMQIPYSFNEGENVKDSPVVLEALKRGVKFMSDPVVKRFMEGANLPGTKNALWADSTLRSSEHIRKVIDQAWVPSDADISELPLYEYQRSIDKKDNATKTHTRVDVCEAQSGRGGYAWRWTLEEVAPGERLGLVVPMSAAQIGEWGGFVGELQSLTALSHFLAGSTPPNAAFFGGRPTKLGKDTARGQRPVTPLMVVMTGTDEEMRTMLKVADMAKAFPAHTAEAQRAQSLGVEAFRAFLAARVADAVVPQTRLGGRVVVSTLADPSDKAAVAAAYDTLRELAASAKVCGAKLTEKEAKAAVALPSASTGVSTSTTTTPVTTGTGVESAQPVTAVSA